jgi:membrane associated rhomboid family serine protease
MALSVNLVLLLATCLLSFLAFSNERIIQDLIFHPPSVVNNKQWYRFFSSGLIHADFLHLAFNMYTFYMFGGMVENAFLQIFGSEGRIFYAIMYLAALPASLTASFQKHRNDYDYYCLGASGAVSAVVFAGIFLYPTLGMGIFPLPFYIPAFIFGPIYLIISAYLSKKSEGSINHSAHIWGSLFGILFLIVTCFFFGDFNPLFHFWQEVSGYLR